MSTCALFRRNNEREISRRTTGTDISNLNSMTLEGTGENSTGSELIDRTVLVSLYNTAMYYIEDEEIPGNLQQRLNSVGTYSPARLVDKENIQVTDSILEYHDPTPSIHDLFMLFNTKFFWGKLGMVEVKWSNRMTSCAGLCCYQGRRGLCSIKLSAPLLSLRPRKDLVETLLHEMIHAYLFVTENYRDREDHGPEFHKHMYRINRQAGTKITVYHSFLDEVAYYQKHIWRCNGPCMHRKPYYGFVKRATNRAPGPYDNWWKEHQKNCGGTFVKVSEPEKTCKKKSQHDRDKNVKPITGVKDLRNYFPSGTPQKSQIPVLNKEYLPKSSNIHTFEDLKMSTSPGKIIVKTTNQSNVLPKGDRVETSKAVANIDADKLDVNESARVRATVRNFWANKYPPANSGGKRSNSMSPILPVEETLETKGRQVSCPVCYLSFSESLIEEHVEDCLSRGKSRSLDETLPIDEFVKMKSGTSTSQSNNTEEQFTLKLAQCPVCNKAMDQKDLNDHLETCLKLSFANEKIEKEDDVCETVPCPCCTEWFQEYNINTHIDECLTFIALKNSLRSG